MNEKTDQSDTNYSDLMLTFDLMTCSCCGRDCLSLSHVVGFGHRLKRFRHSTQGFDYDAPWTYCDVRCPDCGAQRQVEISVSIQELLAEAPELIQQIERRAEESVPPEHRLTPEKKEAFLKRARELHEKIRKSLERDQKGPSHG